MAKTTKDRIKGKKMKNKKETIRIQKITVMNPQISMMI